MSEWIVDIQSMIPLGQMGERMLVARVDRTANTFELMHGPTLTSHQSNEAFGENEVLLKSGWSNSTFGQNEIDQFLQAMMEAGWKRGLRPKNFDPSAGELVAVQRHLEDMRRIGMAFSKTVEDVTGDIGADEKKTW